jgi:pimeloyl-ACP methyl ester carboxylesterase
MWDGQFEVLARRFRAIRYDVRAHGLSRADSVSFADHEDLRQLMVALEVPSATIIGLSMGGQIATDFALAYPEVVSALVLVGPGLSGHTAEDEELQAYMEDLTAAFETGGFTSAIEVFARYWCDGPQREPSQVNAAVRERVLTMLEGGDERWRYWALSRQLEPPAIERLGEIDVPTLAIVGSIDMAVIHEIVDLIAGQVPDVQKLVIPDVAHMVNMEKPDEFNDLVLEFLADLK